MKCLDPKYVHVKQSDKTEELTLSGNGKCFHYFDTMSGKLVISDPFYVKGSKTQEIIEKAKPGRWYALVEKRSGAVANLRVYHEKYQKEDVKGFVRRPGFVSVDFGRLGVFDWYGYDDAEQFDGYKQPAVYVKNGKERKKKKPSNTGHPFYDFCNDIARSDKQAGLIPTGCVCGTNEEEVGYPFWVLRDTKGEAIGVEVCLTRLELSA